MQVYETSSEVIDYLRSRQIFSAYQKAKQKITTGEYRSVGLSKRQPKSSSIWYFRITKKYRAFAVKKDDTLLVFKISDHQ